MNLNQLPKKAERRNRSRQPSEQGGQRRPGPANPRSKADGGTGPANPRSKADGGTGPANPRSKADGGNALPLGNGPSSLPRYHRLRPGRDLALARFDHRRQRCKGGAWDQPQRLGGGASGHGREFRLHRRRRDPAARDPAITSAGGYLRELARKAEANEFSIGPMLMALIGRPKSRQETRMRARESRQVSDYARVVACAESGGDSRVSGASRLRRATVANSERHRLPLAALRPRQQAESARSRAGTHIEGRSFAWRRSTSWP